jgi:hypothetical protein
MQLCNQNVVANAKTAVSYERAIRTTRTTSLAHRAAAVIPQLLLHPCRDRHAVEQHDNP